MFAGGLEDEDLVIEARRIVGILVAGDMSEGRVVDEEILFSDVNNEFESPDLVEWLAKLVEDALVK